jgi:hypothetical protein
MRKYLLGVAVVALLAAVTAGPARADFSDEWSPNYILKDSDLTRFEQRTITGRLERTDHGLAIRSGSAEYLVTGKDLSPFVGNKVAATGKVTEAGGKKTISVTSARICEYC